MLRTGGRLHEEFWEEAAQPVRCLRSGLCFRRKPKTARL
jgi:hypothetical protein